MAVHVKIVQDLEDRLMAHVIKPLEDRIAALEAKLAGGAEDAQTPAKTSRGRGRTAAAEAPAAEPQATVHDAVVAAEADAGKPAAGDAPKGK